MTSPLTPAQHRLVALIRAAGDCAEYWPVVNDWLNLESGALALNNINRTVATLIRKGVITVNDDGVFQLTENNQ